MRACRDVAQLNNDKVVRGEGMPISKSPGSKGNLRIQFKIEYPRALSDQQKAALRQILPRA